MTNPLKRGSAPNRDHPDYERPGSFKPGHQKVERAQTRHAERPNGGLQTRNS